MSFKVGDTVHFNGSKWDGVVRKVFSNEKIEIEWNIFEGRPSSAPISARYFPPDFGRFTLLTPLSEEEKEARRMKKIIDKIHELDDKYKRHMEFKKNGKDTKLNKKEGMSRSDLMEEALRAGWVALDLHNRTYSLSEVTQRYFSHIGNPATWYFDDH